MSALWGGHRLPTRSREARQAGCLQSAQVLLNIKLTSIFTEWLLRARGTPKEPAVRSIDENDHTGVKSQLYKCSERKIIVRSGTT